MISTIVGRKIRSFKQVVALGYIFSLLFISVVNIRPVSAFSGGDGSPSNPYQIHDCSDLQNMSTNLSANYRLVANIDCSSTSTWNDGVGFQPVGSPGEGYYFTGNLDGRGYAIDALYINRDTNASATGLFGATLGSTISDLTLTNVNIHGGTSTGSLVGYGVISVENVHILSGSVTGVNNTGGMFGDMVGTHFDNLSSNVTVNGANYVGGMFGVIQFGDNDYTLTNSYSSGDVTGGLAIGGFAGFLNWGTIRNVYASGVVRANSSSGDGGGLIGQFCNGIIDQSYAVGHVAGESRLGGFLGASENCGGTISNSYARGNIDIEIGGYGGSFAGATDGLVITNSFSTGYPSGITDGGFVYQMGDCTGCNNNFFDSESSSQSVGHGATAKNTIEMKTVGTYTNTLTVGLTSAWDFVANPNNDSSNNDYWNIDSIDNDGYPFLTSQRLSPIITSTTPSNFGDNVSTNANLVMNLNVPSGVDHGLVKIYNSNTGELHEAIEVSSSPILGNGTNQITINPAKDFSNGTTYYVTIESTVLRANNGLYFAGIDNASQWRFITSGASIGGGRIKALPGVFNIVEGHSSSLSIKLPEPIIGASGTPEVRISATAENEGVILGANEVVFDSDEWQSPKSLNLSVHDDNIFQGDRTSYINFRVTNNYSEYYYNYTFRVQVNIIENDTPVSGENLAQSISGTVTLSGVSSGISSDVIDSGNISKDIAEAIGDYSDNSNSGQKQETSTEVSPEYDNHNPHNQWIFVPIAGVLGIFIYIRFLRSIGK